MAMSLCSSSIPTNISRSENLLPPAGIVQDSECMSQTSVLTTVSGSGTSSFTPDALWMHQAKKFNSDRENCIHEQSVYARTNPSGPIGQSDVNKRRRRDRGRRRISSLDSETDRQNEGGSSQIKTRMKDKNKEGDGGSAKPDKRFGQKN
ncbi:unnamed protein product [Pleuronectes platessa]|uniref:Uncharacterized protein n=1 Tax=Pleuronectes platessa TaxID=8262 RepID=A0A9N7TWG3_PLEPL|nr:unnamed protein product [Pleuronectes platessa]